jgi:SAM-dependent methyltransferase
VVAIQGDTSIPVVLLDWSDSLTSSQICPACGAAGGRQTLTISVSYFCEPLHLFECSSCHSLHFDHHEIIESYSPLGELFWQYYVEVGAGIEAMIRPLIALGDRGRGRLLDVGCGFGYVPHFWTHSGRGDAIGIEQAPYGRIGAKVLGAEIYSSSIADCAAISDLKFDLVYASEVIEHTQAPQTLLRDLGEKLAPDGILVLTTPSADYIAPHRPAWQIVSMLSPGQHYFLLSANALHDLVTKAGLPYCEIREVNGRLMAWASGQPLPVISLDAFDWDEYLDYLGRIGSLADRSVACGALYRLFKDSLNTRQIERAKTALTRLHCRARKDYATDPFLIDPTGLTRARTFDERLQLAPAWLSGALLFRGLLNEIEQGAPQHSCELLATAILLLEHDARIGAQLTGEAAAFLPFAKTQYNKALARSFSPAETIPSDATSFPRRTNHLCFFAHFDHAGRIADHVVHYVRELQAAGFGVVFVTAANPPSSELAKVAPYVLKSIVRNNIGHDFGSWIEADRQHPADPRGLLLLCNDSVYGPLWDLKKTLAELVSVEADLYGMVMSNEHVRHIQSWFMLFTPQAHQSWAFRTLMTSRSDIRSRQDVIENIELRLTKILESNGLRSHALYDPRRLNSPPNIASNPSHFLWQQLLEIYGVPFIKIALLQSNPMQLNLAAVPEVVGRHSEKALLATMPFAVAPNGASSLFSRPQVYAMLVEMDERCGRRGWRRLQRANFLLLVLLREADRVLMLARRIPMQVKHILILARHILGRCKRRLLGSKAEG